MVASVACRAAQLSRLQFRVRMTAFANRRRFRRLLFVLLIVVIAVVVAAPIFQLMMRIFAVVQAIVIVNALM